MPDEELEEILAEAGQSTDVELGKKIVGIIKKRPTNLQQGGPISEQFLEHLGLVCSGLIALLFSERGKSKKTD